jgi:hypothetical protein
VPSPDKSPAFRTVSVTLALQNGGKTTTAEAGGRVPHDQGPPLYRALAELRAALLELLPENR